MLFHVSYGLCKNLIRTWSEPHIQFNLYTSQGLQNKSIDLEIHGGRFVRIEAINNLQYKIWNILEMKFDIQPSLLAL